jgi:type IV secretory pathway VirB10-like protein
VIVAGVLIGCGAFASAAIGPWRGWIGRAYERLVPTVAPVIVTAERAGTHPLVSAHAATVAAQPLAVATPPAKSPLPDVAPPDAPVSSRAPIAPPHLRHETPPPAAREEARREETRHEAAREREKQEQETQSVLAGMRALRVDHDPVRARALLARYLERHPNGALAEEALALTIEAAVAHQDGDAPALGARYLRRYPGGPFRELASRAQR